MRARPISAFVALLGVLAGSTGVAAQEECVFLEGSGDLQIVTLSGGMTITYVGTPNMRCRDGVRIRADSVISFEAQGMEHLIGNVRFFDRSGELRADEARYFGQLGRLQAEGSLFVRDTVQGYTIENGRMVYLRQTSFREQAQIDVVTGFDGVRPRATVTMKPADRPDSTVSATDSLGPPPVAAAADSTNSPYVVDGDRIFIEGDTYFRATGTVEIQRDSLHAFADSAEYDQVAGRMLLQGSARVDGPTYDLVGRTINLGMSGDDIDEVVARREAVLTGEDLRLTAPLIRMYLQGGALDRLVATGLDADAVPEEGDASLPRPHATSDRFDLTADSIEVLAPAEVLERIFAAGSARSVSAARDSLNVESLPALARNDWLEGDTVIVTFLPRDSMAAEQDSATYRIDRITAVVSARSLYRLPPADSTAVAGVDPPAVHYVVGNQISIVMREGEVDRMEVLGQTSGVHLEPLPKPPVADSLNADSTAARDTTRVSPPAPDPPSLAGTAHPPHEDPDDPRAPRHPEPAATMERARDES